MKSNLKYYCLLLLIVCSSCKKFLDVLPNNNQLNPSTIQDFEEMLNNTGLATPDFLVADLMSDDVQFPDGMLSLGVFYYTNAYLWNKEVWTARDTDPIYANSYQCILQTNIIIDHIDKAKDGSLETKAMIKAQAKINRAYYYLQLVNLYGNDYQLARANTDLGVPLILHPDPTSNPQRNTVQAVYNQILQDLTDALNVSTLPNFGVDVIHPGKAAAYALLARTYLLMGNYPEALAASEAALKMRNSLLDYNSFQLVDPDWAIEGVIKPNTLRDQQNNPEVILARVAINEAFIKRFKATFLAGNDFDQVFEDDTDLRYLYGFAKSDFRDNILSFIPYSNNGAQSMQFNYSLGVPEIMLIKAECLARQGGNDTNVLDLLNQLRKFRFDPGDYEPLTVTPNDDALSLVLQERRRELMFHGGLRLFDLKRLNREARFKKDLKRISVTNNTTLATLPAGSPRYVLPFAPMTVANNPLMIQNER